MKTFRGARVDESLLAAAGVADEAEWDFLDFAYRASMEIAALMEAKGVNKAELAERLGKTRPFVSKVLSGEHNLTFRTFSSMVHALGGVACVTVRDASPGATVAPPASDPRNRAPIRPEARRSAGNKERRDQRSGGADNRKSGKSNRAAA